MMAHDPCWSASYPANTSRPLFACRRWGVNVHFTFATDSTLAALSRAFKIVRMDLRWATVEPAAGVYNYNWTAYDRWVSLQERSGLQPYLILDGANPKIIPPSPGCPSGCKPATPEARAKWVRFAVAAMRRYANRSIVWELENEPNGGWWAPKPNATDYARLALALAAAKRAAGSGIAQEVLVGPALAGMTCWTSWQSHQAHCEPYDYLREMAAAGGLAAFDALSVHPYVVGAPEQHDDAAGRSAFMQTWGGWATLRETLRGYPNGGLPLLSGEWGWATCSNRSGGGGDQPAVCDRGASPDASSESDQAMYLARQWLSNVRHNLSISIYYDWEDDGGNSSLGEDNFGVLRHDGKTPKPAYAAASTLQRLFGSRNYLGGVPIIGGNATGHGHGHGHGHGRGAFAFGMAFGAPLAAPASPTIARPLPSAATQGFGTESVDALAIWSLALPLSCSAPSLVGVGHRTKCPGRFFEGPATLLSNSTYSTCEGLCRQTPGCRSYAVWPSPEGGERHCRADYSRCAAPQYQASCWDGRSASCGEDNASYVRAYSLSQAACTLSLSVQVAPSPAQAPPAASGGWPGAQAQAQAQACFDEVGYLGVRSGRQHRQTPEGVLQISGVGEAPVYLLRAPCAKRDPSTARR